MFHKKLIFFPMLLMLTIFAAACAAAPPQVVTQEIEVTREVPVTVEVTRVVEVAAAVPLWQAARDATAAYADVAAAKAAGYVPITPCMANPELGAMGIHYGNPALIEDPALDVAQPEVVMYQPLPNGGMDLLGVEYIVPAPLWTGAEPPTLLGEEFELNEELDPPLYALHLWVWRDNPAGLFADFNPNVSCPTAKAAAMDSTTEAGSPGGLVSSIQSAPIVPDGDVMGSATDIVITLAASLDPATPGRTLMKGKTIRVTLPDAFVFENPAEFPVVSVASSPECVPGNVQCSTGVLLQGWPQRPIPPPKYAFTYDAATNSLIYTALEDLTPAPPSAPGIKQMHLILRGFNNPDPGQYEVQIAAETGPEGALETGIGTLAIVAGTQPRISVTSAFNEGAPNTMHQSTAVGKEAPLPYDFLLWDKDGEPLVGVTIQAGSPNSLLVQGDRVVGEVQIAGPTGANGAQIVAAEPSALINAPILGVPAARLNAQFQAGSEPGEYITTFSLKDGNAVYMVVQAARTLVTAKAVSILSDQPGRAIVSARGNHFVVDSVPPLNGPNEEMNPLDAILGALGSCGVFVYEKAAQEMDIPVTGISAMVQGYFNPAGVKDGSVNPRIQALRVHLTVDGANNEQLAALAEEFQARCPIYTTLSRAADIEITHNDEAMSAAIEGLATATAVATLSNQPGRAIVTARGNHFVIDSVPPLGGPNEERNPLDLILGALATCGTFVYEAAAQEMDIPLNSIAVTVEGDFNPVGVKDGSVNPRIQAFRVNMLVSGVTAAQADALADQFQARCPIYTTLSRSAPVDIVNSIQ